MTTTNVDLGYGLTAVIEETSRSKSINIIDNNEVNKAIRLQEHQFAKIAHIIWPPESDGGAK